MINQINKIIFKYLDNQNFIVTESTDRFYFFNSEGDKYNQISYDKTDGWCYIYYKLIDEISAFFSIKYSDSKEIIGRWVESTLQIRVTHTYGCGSLCSYIVESTLQMRVTHIKEENERCLEAVNGG
jgi:hypothetical protein